MAKYGAFAPYGLARYGSGPSKAEGVYASLVAGVTNPKTGKSPFNLTPGPGNYYEAKLCARAISVGFALAAIERAEAQGDVTRAIEGLPNLEWDYAVTPAPNAPVPARQAVLAAKKRAGRGASRPNVIAVLQSLLGAKLTAYVTRADTTLYPADPEASDAINSVRRDLVSKWAVTTEPIAPAPGGPLMWCGYGDMITTDDPVTLAPGDLITVGGENIDTVEAAVLVRDVRGSGATRAFQANFGNAHDLGCTITTARFYPQISNARLQHIVVTAAAAADPSTRALINDAMPDICRAVSTWAIIADNGGGSPLTPLMTVGPSGSPLGAAALDHIAYTAI